MRQLDQGFPCARRLPRLTSSTMRRALILFLIIAAIPAFAQERSGSNRVRCVEMSSTKACLLYAASIIDLIANPDLFDGKRIRTFGYIHFEFEGNGIYLHQEDYARSLYLNGLWVTLAEKLHPQTARIVMCLSEEPFVLVIGGIVGSYDQKEWKKNRWRTLS